MFQIRWEDRNVGANGSRAKVSVDGTDCPIEEPRPAFNPKWHSHKLNAAGLRYEIGMCIQTGLMVWINGPYPPGSWPDLRIFRHRMVDALDNGEWIVADEGYKEGQQFVLNKKWARFPVWWKRMASRVLSKHENINSQFKKWRILCMPFRHLREMHEGVFKGIGNVVQIQLTLSRGWQEYGVVYADHALFNQQGELVV